MTDSSTFTVTLDGETETYDLLLSGLTFAEARAVEKVTGLTFQEIGSDAGARTKTDVLQALLWVSMKRRRPTLTFADLDDLAIDSITWASDQGEEADPFVDEDTPGELDGVLISASSGLST